MKRETKGRIVEDVRNQLDTSRASFLVDYRGIKVADLSEFRRNLREKNSRFQVVKNSLALRAVARSELEALREFLVGPTGIVFGGDDPVSPAKVIGQFIEDHPQMTVKCGVLGERVISAADVEGLSNLPAREVLLAQVVAQIQAPVSGLVWTLAAPLTQLVGVLQSLSEKVKTGGVSMAVNTEEQAKNQEGVAEQNKTEELISTIEKMNVLELSQLVKQLQDRFGVQAMAPQAAAQPAQAEAAPEEEKVEFDVVLSEVGGKKIQVIKEVRKLTSLGLKEAKELVESAPKPVREGVTKEEAEKIKETLEGVGAKIEIK